MNFDTPQRGRLRGQVLAAGGLIVLGVLVWLFWPRIGLEGDTHKDFGKVSFEQGPHVLEHVFALRNTSSDSFQVMKFGSTCGCTQATGSGMIVEPGEELLIPITLRLTQSGHKEGRVTVYFREGGSIDLNVEAWADPQRTFRVNHQRIRLRKPSGRGSVKVAVESWEKPEPLSVVASPDLIAEFLGWEKIRAGNREKGQVPEWSGHVAVEGVKGVSVLGGDLRLRLGDEELTVGVNLPRNLAPPTSEPVGQPPAPEASP